MEWSVRLFRPLTCLQEVRSNAQRIDIAPISLAQLMRGALRVHQLRLDRVGALLSLWLALGLHALVCQEVVHRGQLVLRGVRLFHLMTREVRLAERSTVLSVSDEFTPFIHA